MMTSAMLRLAPDNSLQNGDNKSVVLKGAGLGGTIPLVRSYNDP